MKSNSGCLYYSFVGERPWLTAVDSN